MLASLGSTTPCRVFRRSWSELPTDVIVSDCGCRISGQVFGGVMGPRDIEDLTIELLAEEAKCSPGEMRRCLEEGGGELPIDSILLVEVVVRVEERCGV